jgi:hypothetical protein
MLIMYDPWIATTSSNTKKASDIYVFVGDLICPRMILPNVRHCKEINKL